MSYLLLFQEADVVPFAVYHNPLIKKQEKAKGTLNPRPYMLSPWVGTPLVLTSRSTLCFA